MNVNFLNITQENAENTAIQINGLKIDEVNGYLQIADASGTHQTSDFITNDTTDLNVNSLAIATTGSTQLEMIDVVDGTHYGVCISGGTFVLTAI
jgi:hypothetical protein